MEKANPRPDRMGCIVLKESAIVPSALKNGNLTIPYEWTAEIDRLTYFLNRGKISMDMFPNL